MQLHPQFVEMCASLNETVYAYMQSCTAKYWRAGILRHTLCINVGSAEVELESCAQQLLLFCTAVLAYL